MRVLIVDDESLARDRLRSQIADIGGHQVVAEAANGIEALQQVQEAQPDVVLLDIRMPGMDGIEAAQHLSRFDNPPAIIFTTAYDQHTLEAFEANASGYLLKPIRREKLEQALQQANRLNQAQLSSLNAQRETSGRTHICARLGGSLQLIPLENILYFHADQKYVTVRHSDGEVIIEEALKALEQEFADSFIRIHRATLVALAWIAGMQKAADNKWILTLKSTGSAQVEETLEVSRRHTAEVRQLLKSL